jgi:hypothetical protein
MAGKSSTAVAKKEATSGAVAAYDGYDGATGFEGMDSSELAIPFLNLLQANSEVVGNGDGAAGDLYNNVMETVYPGADGVAIIPVARQRVYVEWVPVDDGGGLVAIHEPDSQFVTEALDAAEDRLNPRCGPDGKHELVETIYLYALLLDDDGGFERVVVSFTSTKLKQYKKLMTKASSQVLALDGGRKIRLPLWAHRYRLTTFRDENKRGQKYHNFKIEFDAETAKECRYAPADSLFQEAEAFNAMVSDGAAKADMSTADKSDAKGGTADDDEVPF